MAKTKKEKAARRANQVYLRRFPWLFKNSPITWKGGKKRWKGGKRRCAYGGWRSTIFLYLASIRSGRMLTKRYLPGLLEVAKLIKMAPEREFMNAGWELFISNQGKGTHILLGILHCETQRRAGVIKDWSFGFEGKSVVLLAERR